MAAGHVNQSNPIDKKNERTQQMAYRAKRLTKTGYRNRIHSDAFGNVPPLIAPPELARSFSPSCGVDTTVLLHPEINPLRALTPWW
jgi:hypothetical protein